MENVYQFVKRRGGATSTEIRQAFGDQAEAADYQRDQMVKSGRLRKSGEQACIGGPYEPVWKVR